jgi:hypothetical protein
MLRQSYSAARAQVSCANQLVPKKAGVTGPQRASKGEPDNFSMVWIGQGRMLEACAGHSPQIANRLLSIDYLERALICLLFLRRRRDLLFFHFSRIMMIIIHPRSKNIKWHVTEQ